MTAPTVDAGSASLTVRPAASWEIEAPRMMPAIHGGVIDTKTVKLRWATTCASCDKELPAGVEATWSRSVRQARCVDCTAPGADAADEPETPPLAEELTQSTIAELLEMDQSEISRLEHRSDMLLSTLKRFIQTTGGEMHIVVSYPDGGPVELLVSED